jgi:basic membrane protein A
MKYWALFPVASKSSRLSFLVVLVICAVTFPSYATAAVHPRIAVIYDGGGRGDGSINDASAAGVDAAKVKFHLSALDIREMVTDGSENDRESRLRFLAKAGYSLIITIGETFAPALKIVGQEFPSTQFAIVNDQTVPLLNVTSVVFSDSEGAFLAGIVAGLSTKTGRVGFINGSISQFSPNVAKAFVRGVHFGKSSVSVIIRNPQFSPVADVSELRSIGVDLIYSLWNKTAEVVRTISIPTGKAMKVRLIGQAPEQFFLNSVAAKRILLSTVTKKLDVAVFDLISLALIGETMTDILDEKNGVYGHSYSIADRGIEISVNGLPIVVRKKISVAKSAIISGKLRISA